jgi:NADH-quinone oxidoreductase subunit C
MTTLPAPGRGLSGDALSLEDLAARLTDRFGEVTVDLAYGELTIHVAPAQLVEVLTFCRDDAELACELLADLSGVHWPAGDHVVDRQPSTTGWPEYRVARDEGVIEVLYVLRSVSRNHRLRVSVGTPDDDPRLPSVTGVYETANFHEREVYDFFGVVFDGHPDLTRILMPDDWLGHPHRKDYPLGGVEIPYKHEKFIPPPNERDLREVVD